MTIKKALASRARVGWIMTSRENGDGLFKEAFLFF